MTSAFRNPFLALMVGLLSTLSVVLMGGQNQGTARDWDFNATIIEACSCTMFCACYFNPHPATHGAHGEGGSTHFCRFNNAFKVNRGHYGSTRLEGVKFWVAGDLGGDFSSGEWAVVTFDRSVTPEQRRAITEIVGHLYPLEWKSLSVAEDAEMEWRAGKDQSVARLDGGRTAEVVLNRFQGMAGSPVVIENLKYWAAPRNEGFVLMPNQVEAYRLGEHAFEYRGTNGFMITLDMNSSDLR